MENVIFQTEHPSEVSLDKKKKNHKNGLSFYDVIKQIKVKQNPKLAAKNHHPERHQVNNKDNEDPVFDTQSKESNIKGVKEKSKINNEDKFRRVEEDKNFVSERTSQENAVKSTNKEIHGHSSQSVKHTDTNLTTIEPKRTEEQVSIEKMEKKQNNWTYIGDAHKNKPGMSENTDQKHFTTSLIHVDKVNVGQHGEVKTIKEMQISEKIDQKHFTTSLVHIDKGNIGQHGEIRNIKEIQEGHHQLKDRKETFGPDTKLTSEKLEKTLDEINQNIKESRTSSTEKNQDNLRYTDDRKFGYVDGDKNYRSLTKQEAGRPVENKNKFLQTISQENPSKPSSRETQIDKIQVISHTNTKNQGEVIDITKNWLNISLERNIDFETTGFSVRESGDLDVRQNSYHNQEVVEVSIGSENPTDIVISGKDGMRNHGGEDFNLNQQSSREQQSTLDKNFNQGRFNLSFNFMDTKISINSNQTNMVMYINTSQLLDPFMVEKIREILTESGFTNHSLVIRDKTKTSRVYTANKTYLENRSNDGFKISA